MLECNHTHVEKPTANSWEKFINYRSSGRNRTHAISMPQNLNWFTLKPLLRNLEGMATLFLSTPHPEQSMPTTQKAKSCSFLTATSLEPSLFHANALIVYKLGISFFLLSSQAPLRGLQLNTRNLCSKTLSVRAAFNCCTVIKSFVLMFHIIKLSTPFTLSASSFPFKSPSILLVQTSRDNYPPVKTTYDNRLTTGTAHSNSKLFLVIISTVIEILKNFPLFSIRYNTLITAGRHDGWTPAQRIRRTGVPHKLTLCE